MKVRQAAAELLTHYAITCVRYSLTITNNTMFPKVSQ